ncbi:MAG: sugar transferase [bacterium]
MKTPVPVTLFVFNRPDHTRRTIDALKKNRGAENTVLYIFSDGPRGDSDVSGVSQVREYIHSVEGFADVCIKERFENLGLCSSVVSGVSEVIDEYDAAVVLEDDIITSPGFLVYMNRSLEKYEFENQVWSVATHSPDIEIPGDYVWDNYVSNRFSCWGWGTWLDRWEQVDWGYDRYDDVFADENAQRQFARGGEDRKYVLDLMRSGRVESWAAVFDFFHFLNGGFCMHPVKSLVYNIGLDRSGTNCGAGADNRKLFQKKDSFNLMGDIHEDERIIREFMAAKRLSWKSRIKMLLRKTGWNFL